MTTAVSETSSSADLPVSAVDRLEIAVAMASSSTGSAGSAVGELAAEPFEISSALTVVAAGDNGCLSQYFLLSDL